MSVIRPILSPVSNSLHSNFMTSFVAWGFNWRINLSADGFQLIRLHNISWSVKCGSCLAISKLTRHQHSSKKDKTRFIFIFSMKIRKWLYLHSYIYLEVLKLKTWKLKSRTEFLLFIILTTYLVLGDPIGLRKERL